MTSGIIVIDKAEGRSSANELARVKRKLALNKVGHAGTLDPMATGVLVCLCGSATRLASYAEKGQKTYSGTIRFGISTDTDDITGEAVSISDKRPTLDAILREKANFIGDIEQVPPNISGNSNRLAAPKGGRS